MSTRDLSLVVFAAVCVIATAVLIGLDAATEGVAPIVGLAGVALGRLSGTSAPTGGDQ